MKLIETKTLGTAAASIEFTSIPQTFTDLVVLYSGRWDGGSTQDSVTITFNSSGTGYTSRWLQGSGASVQSSNTTVGLAGFAVLPGTSATANTFGSGQVYISNYIATVNKSFSADSVGENNGTFAYQSIVANLWANTAAITSLSMNPFSGGNFVAGSTFSLYGILKGSDGIVTTS